MRASNLDTGPGASFRFPRDGAKLCLSDSPFTCRHRALTQKRVGRRRHLLSKALALSETPSSVTKEGPARSLCLLHRPAL